MPTRRIGDITEQRPCFHPDHDPPSHAVLKAGIYEHECPQCGKKVIFHVRDTYLSSAKWEHRKTDKDSDELTTVKWKGPLT